LTQTNGRRLIVFTRYPEPGKSKTRLIPALGPKGAAELQRRMTLHTIIVARGAAQKLSLTLEVRYTGAEETEFKSWLGPDLAYRTQCHGELGCRMSEAFQQGFDRGDRSIVLIGSDTPDLKVDIIVNAFASLDSHDLVLGPSRDGGYYLIGLRRPAPELFQRIYWSTGQVLGETLDRAHRIGLSVTLLDQLSDIDLPEDLPVAERALPVRPKEEPPLISVIIPTLDEAAHICDVLSILIPESALEVIVVDGGSLDDTCRLAEVYGARVVTSEKGRARQMNAGAATARGQILLFLHADTILPSGFLDPVENSLRRPGVVGGAFLIRYDSYTPMLRLIQWSANFRSRWFQLPYGDQALFLSSSLFRELGGFPNLPVMEDLALVRRLRKRGKIVTLAVPAVTSARSWLTIGTWRVTFFHITGLFAYWLGVSPNKIHTWFLRGGYYHSKRALRGE